MFEERVNNNRITGLIILGSILRLAVFWVSPPNNAYDDHLEVINIYATQMERPLPSDCWECYQPPLYYYLGAMTYRVAEYWGGSQLACWKVVQAINPVLSIMVLILTYQILLILNLRKSLITIALSFLVILPRDIFTSVMIGNDYLLVFFSITALYLFCKTLEALKKEGKLFFWFVLLVLVATLGTMTKQHGLLLFLFPGLVFLVLCRSHSRSRLNWAIAILLIGSSISLSEEFRNYQETGHFLVSNQDYFNYAEQQFPGSIKKVEFLTFRISELYKEPFISENTSASLATELFARTFFDYEWRFLSPKITWASTLGRIGYFVGFAWIIFFLATIVLWLKNRQKSTVKINLYAAITKLGAAFLAGLFFVVPFIQTARYPYFSSMKSMFMLSGIIIFIVVISSVIKEKSLLHRLGSYLAIVNIFYGILLVFSIYFYFDISLYNLHGPLWPYP